MYCPKECCIELLARWMRQNGTEATVGKLTEALEKLDIRNAANNLISGKKENSGFPAIITPIIPLIISPKRFFTCYGAMVILARYCIATRAL